VTELSEGRIGPLEQWKNDRFVMPPCRSLSSAKGNDGCMEIPRLSRAALLLLATSMAVGTMVAQGPPPPPPLQPLAPPVAPAGNPVTTDKTQLGKVLFWDEQLSSTRTVACGTCHQPAAGGSDPRSTPSTLHPGPDGVFGNGDDIVGSPGVISTDERGLQQLADFFGISEQVTGRYSPSVINSAYPPDLFWDGRATGTFTDPVSGAVVLASGAALESQAAGPPTSSVEMAHAGRDWTAVASRIAHAKPLTLSPSVPADLSAWIAGRSYEQLFQAAFGSSGVTPSRIVMAIATYERSLVSNQSPIDAFIARTPGALTAQEQEGLNLFRTHGCAGCHSGNRFTDDAYHYIGVRPQGEDLGRSTVTGINGNRGQFKTPTLRNVALRGEYMHNGRFGTLEEVVEFYDRGGDFNAPNKPPVIQPLGLTTAEKAALVAFLGRPLTDPRVAAETGPFSRPALSAGTAASPRIVGEVVADEAGNLPLMTAVEPALAGSANFTVGLSRLPVGRQVWLAIDDEPIATGSGVPEEGDVKYLHRLNASGGRAGMPPSARIAPDSPVSPSPFPGAERLMASLSTAAGLSMVKPAWANRRRSKRRSSGKRRACFPRRPVSSPVAIVSMPP
jgi:cytochrome c peroxidase